MSEEEGKGKGEIYDDINFDIKELEGTGLSKEEIANALKDEGYALNKIMQKS